MDILENRGLVVHTANPGRIIRSIKHSGMLGDGSVLVRWNLSCAQDLVKLGFKHTPSPIQRDYSYAGIDPPMAHQKKMAEFMSLRQRCFNFSEMGCAKTRACVWAADYLMSIGVIKRVLVACPLSIVYTAWAADIFNAAVHRTIGVAVGEATRRSKVVASDCEFCIINHDTFKSSFKDLLKANFDLIIVDECSVLSNTQTKMWKAVKALIKERTWLWMLTGTPAANSPLQAYGLAKLVNPCNVPSFFTAWKDMTMYKISNFTSIPKPGVNKTVLAALQPAIRIEKKDCLDLPPLTYQMREVPMDSLQEKYYQRMKAQMLMEAAGETITAVNAGVLMNKLLQIAAGGVYSDSGEVVDFNATSRLQEMLGVIQECSEKVLVFATYKSTIRAISAFLVANKIACATIDGEVSANERRQRIDLFQNSDTLKVLVMQPRTAAHGLTLTRASTTIWFSPVSSLEIWKQANARMDRPGQVHAMTIVQLCGAPVEKKVYRVLNARGAGQDELTKLLREEIGLR